MFIFSNLATSIDGKIATASRVHFPLGTSADRDEMHVQRRRCDAIIMGASTIRAYKRPCKARGKKKQPINIIVSRALEGFSPAWPFFTDPSIRRILIVTQKLSPAQLRAYSPSSEIITLTKVPKGKLGSRIVAALKKKNIKKLLVEGGGGLMWDFAGEDLIDEYHVTLTPWVLGGTEAPTLVDGLGFDPSRVLPLRLAKWWKVKNELFLVYRRVRAK